MLEISAQSASVDLNTDCADLIGKGNAENFENILAADMRMIL